MDDAMISSWKLAVYGQRSRVQGLALLVWDTLLTIDDESQLFWRQPFTFPTCLFLWSRYGSIIIHAVGAVVNALPELSDEMCLVWLNFEAWSGISIIFAVELILQLRIYALFGQSRKIGAMLLVTSLVQILLIGIIGAVFIAGASNIVAENQGYLRRCSPGHITHTSVVFWVGLLMLESVLLVLGFVKAMEYYRSPSRTGQKLHYVLLRDSLIYTLVIIGVYGINIHTWASYLPEAYDSSCGLLIALPSTIAGRMMISVRKVYTESLDAFSETEIARPRSTSSMDGREGFFLY